MAVVADRNIDSLIISSSAPFDPAERTTWPNRCASNNVAVVWVERPVDTAFLAKPNYAPHKVRSRPAEIEVWAARYGTVRICSRSAEARHRPGIKTLQPLGPFDLTRPQIQRKSGIEEIVRRSAVRGGICILAGFHVRR